MFNQVHASDGIHGAIRPRQILRLEINPLKRAPGGIIFRSAGFIGSEENKVGSEFRKMAEGFAIGRAEVEQVSLMGRGRDKGGASVYPR